RVAGDGAGRGHRPHCRRRECSGVVGLIEDVTEKPRAGTANGPGGACPVSRGVSSRPHGGQDPGGLRRACCRLPAAVPDETGQLSFSSTDLTLSSMLLGLSRRSSTLITDEIRPAPI